MSGLSKHCPLLAACIQHLHECKLYDAVLQHTSLDEIDNDIELSDLWVTLTYNEKIKRVQDPLELVYMFRTDSEELTSELLYRFVSTVRLDRNQSVCTTTNKDEKTSNIDAGTTNIDSTSDEAGLVRKIYNAQPVHVSSSTLVTLYDEYSDTLIDHIFRAGRNDLMKLLVKTINFERNWVLNCVPYDWRIKIPKKYTTYSYVKYTDN